MAECGGRMVLQRLRWQFRKINCLTLPLWEASGFGRSIPRGP